MPRVVFIAPFFMETTLRFVDAVASLPTVRLGLISQDSDERLPSALRAKIEGHYRVHDGLSKDELSVALVAMRRALGSVDCLLGTLEQLQVTLGELRQENGLAGVHTEVARNFRDKALMKDLLRAEGIACARHRLASSASEVEEFAREVGFPLVVKPPEGAGAQATFRLDDAPALAGYLTSMPPRAATPCLVEQFLTGAERSFDSIMVDGEIRWFSVNEYLPSPLEVLREPWIQWCVLSRHEQDAPDYDAIRQAAPRALRALGLRDGMSHMEWFHLSDGSAAISEVGARPPGAQFTSIMSYACDVDFYRAWARLMVLGEFDPPARPFAVGAAFVRAQGTGREVGAIHGLGEASSELGDMVVACELPEPGQRPSKGYEGDGYVILRHPDTAAVERGLARLIRTLRVETRKP